MKVPIQKLHRTKLDIQKLRTISKSCRCNRRRNFRTKIKWNHIWNFSSWGIDGGCWVEANFNSHRLVTQYTTPVMTTLAPNITYYIHHSQKKTVWPWKNHTWHGPQMCQDWWKPCHTPHVPMKISASENWGSFIGSWLLKSTLQGLICWSNASWHFQRSRLSEHHPWSMSKLWENKVMVVILAHHTWSPQPSPREWKAKSWVAPQLLRKAVWLCWPLASLQPPDFFGRARAVVWFPCRRDLGEWLDMDSRRKGFFCLKKWARFTRMVSDGSSFPVWKDTNYVISCRDSGRIFMTPSLKNFTHPHHVSPNSHPLFSIDISVSLGFAGLAGSWSKRKNIPLLKQKNIKWLAYQLIDCISTGPTLPNIQDT